MQPPPPPVPGGAGAAAAVSALLADAGLTRRQCTLLDELAESVSLPVVSGPSTASGNACLGTAEVPEGEDQYEAFYRYWHGLKARRRQLEGDRGRSQWMWIDKVQDICSSTCSELDTLLQQLLLLDKERQEVVRKTTALHEQCQQMVQDQEQLSRSAESLSERLDYYDRVADVARLLDQGHATTSHTEFASVLDRLDGSVAFLQAHPDFAQSQAYLHQFEHLRSRACISVRSALQRSLEKSTAQVEQQLREKAVGDGMVDTQVFYTRFRAAAPNHKPLMSLLHKRLDVHDTYVTTLDELEAFYVHLRLRLIASPVISHLQGVLRKDLQLCELAPATRQASSYILEVSQFEQRCFEAYFELRQPQESLRTLLERVADIFYQALRPIVIACDSIESLREMADCLQMDILEPQQHGTAKGTLVPVLAVVYRLHKDVQERLIFCVESYIRDEIKSYQPAPSDMDFPGSLFDAAMDPSSSNSGADDAGDVSGGVLVAAVALQRGWYPTMHRTVVILEKIYRVLEMSTFQGLAQEAVDLCISSLKRTAAELARRPLPQPAEAEPLPPTLIALTQAIDSHLFLVRHLLALREWVAAFECDLVVSEKYFNFSNVWEALHLKLPDGLLGILKPTVSYTQVDSKKDIEAELKTACEALMTNITAHISQPLASLNVQISDFLAKEGVTRASLKDQPFMAPDQLRVTVASFLANIRGRVPFVAANVRLYLAAGGGAVSSAAATAAAAGAAGRGGAAMPSDHGQSTASILFKPVEMRLVDTWGRLEGLLEECLMTPEELNDLGFIRQGALRELVASLFESTMAAPWEQLVGTVSSVVRARPATAAATAARVAAADAAAPAGQAAPIPADSEVAAQGRPLHPAELGPADVGSVGLAQLQGGPASPASAAKPGAPACPPPSAEPHAPAGESAAPRPAPIV